MIHMDRWELNQEAGRIRRILDRERPDDIDAELRNLALHPVYSGFCGLIAIPMYWHGATLLLLALADSMASSAGIRTYQPILIVNEGRGFFGIAHTLIVILGFPVSWAMIWAEAFRARPVAGLFHVPLYLLVLPTYAAAYLFSMLMLIIMVPIIALGGLWRSFDTIVPLFALFPVAYWVPFCLATKWKSRWRARRRAAQIWDTENRTPYCAQDAPTDVTGWANVVAIEMLRLDPPSLYRARRDRLRDKRRWPFRWIDRPGPTGESESR